jgi:hypothetical protein
MSKHEQKTEHREESHDATPKSSESALKEAHAGMGGLVNDRQKLINYLKEGGKSGITDDFGKPLIHDSSKDDPAKKKELSPHGADLTHQTGDSKTLSSDVVKMDDGDKEVYFPKNNSGEQAPYYAEYDPKTKTTKYYEPGKDGVPVEIKGKELQEKMAHDPAFKHFHDEVEKDAAKQKSHTSDAHHPSFEKSGHQHHLTKEEIDKEHQKLERDVAYLADMRNRPEALKQLQKDLQKLHDEDPVAFAMLVRRLEHDHPTLIHAHGDGRVTQVTTTGGLGEVEIWPGKSSAEK